MISRVKKTHTNEHTIRGRLTLKDAVFLERVGLHALREINLGANILSEFIKNYVIPKEPSTGAINLIKSNLVPRAFITLVQQNGKPKTSGIKRFQ